jgi:hypothetical protein
MHSTPVNAPSPGELDAERGDDLFNVLLAIEDVAGELRQ